MKQHKEMSGKFHVKKENLAIEIGSGNLAVLGTPALIAFMENIASDLVQKDIPPNQSSVGVKMDMAHLGPSRLDAEIKINCKISKKKGQSIYFHIEAYDNNKLVGKAKHTRVIIDRKNFLAKYDII